MSDNGFIHKEAFWTIVGESLGRGSGRQVYACTIRPDLVVKIEDGVRSFQNVAEWEAWSWIQGTEAEKWFSPCRFISPCGSVLFMDRTIIARDKEYPALMPKFLADFKKENYGLLNGRLVCHDYGTTLLVRHGLTKALRKVKWE